MTVSTFTPPASAALDTPAQAAAAATLANQPRQGRFSRHQVRHRALLDTHAMHWQYHPHSESEILGLSQRGSHQAAYCELSLRRIVSRNIVSFPTSLCDIGWTEPEAAARVRAGVIQIQIRQACVRPVVPVAAPDRESLNFTAPPLNTRRT